MPLEHRVGAGMPRTATAAVFIADAATGPMNSAETLSALFDLTPAESRVFALIVEGRELAEIGTELSISPATAKTHLARIYQKTGKSSRGELVRLSAEIAPPV